MQAWRTSTRLSWALLVGLLALLGLLGWLQAQWLSEASAAEEHRIRSAIADAGQRFAVDFDRELTRVFLHFAVAARLDPGDLSRGVAQRLADWRVGASPPDPVRDVWLLPVSREVRGHLRRLDEQSGVLVEEEPSGELLELLEHWTNRGPGRGWRGRGPRSSGAPLALPALPGFVVPLFAEPAGSEPFELEHLRSHLVGVLAVRLDRSALAAGLLSELAASELSLAGEPVRFAVFSAGVSEPLLANPAGWRGDDGEGQIELPLFELLAPEEVRRRTFGEPFPAGRLRALELLLRSQGGRRPVLPGPVAGGWRLVLGHPAGPLEAVLEAQQRRSYTLGFGVLLLLGASAILVWSTTRRAQRLASRQLETVAALTHELRTPLAGVGSLGQNLADGIVADAEQVRRYGAMIQREVGRLSLLVEQALELSGILSGKSLREIGPVAIEEVLEEAMAAVAPLVAERAVVVEQQVDGVPPRLRGEARALARALVNLLQNAVHHAGDGGWVGVRVLREDGGRLAVEVRDRGPGIPADERERLFEPFFRGRRAYGERVPGSGLGLALVRQIAEAHGGCVEVVSPPDGGALFRLLLPADR